MILLTQSNKKGAIHDLLILYVFKVVFLFIIFSVFYKKLNHEKSAFNFFILIFLAFQSCKTVSNKVDKTISEEEKN